MTCQLKFASVSDDLMRLTPFLFSVCASAKFGPPSLMATKMSPHNSSFSQRAVTHAQPAFPQKSEIKRRKDFFLLKMHSAWPSQMESLWEENMKTRHPVGKPFRKKKKFKPLFLAQSDVPCQRTHFRTGMYTQ